MGAFKKRISKESRSSGSESCQIEKLKQQKTFRNQVWTHFQLLFTPKLSNQWLVSTRNVIEFFRFDACWAFYCTSDILITTIIFSYMRVVRWCAVRDGGKFRHENIGLCSSWIIVNLPLKTWWQFRLWCCSPVNYLPFRQLLRSF